MKIKKGVTVSGFRFQWIFIIYCILYSVCCLPAFALITIDGSLDDWRGITPIAVLDQREQLHESPGNWQGTNDLSGKIFFTQDSDYIYIAAEVRDDKPLWEPHGTVVQEQWWKSTYDGDALRVKIITSTVTTDLFLFPGAFGVNPQIYIHHSTTEKSGIYPEGKIASSYVTKFSGYLLKSRLPKSVLGLPSEELTLQFELFDGDGPANTDKSMLSKPISIPSGK